MKLSNNEIYTLEEAQTFLKISRSTLLRLIKKNLIRTSKIGRQHRIWGKEILHVMSPTREENISGFTRVKE